MSAGISMIAAFPGTAGGAGAGIACAVTSKNFLIDLGCWLGGGVLAFFGSALNPVLAPITIPIGIAIGLAINITLSIVLGWCFLVPLVLWWNGNVPWKRLVLGGGEMIPGVNNVPFWTFFTVAALWKTATQKGTRARKGVLQLASLAAIPARSIMATKEQTADREGMREGLALGGEVQSQTAWPTSGRELIRAAEQHEVRPLFHDIRPKPNVQTT